MNPPPEALRERLPAHPSSVGRARRLLRGTTAADLPQELVEAAELLVSEVVSNAVVHAGTPIEIRVSTTSPTSIYVEVSDGSPHNPVARHYAATAGTGRGLRLLTELSDDWGVSVGDSGKTVWFRVSAGEGTPGQAADHESDRETGRRTAPAETVEINLLNVPVPLHAQWQEHAAGLLREYLLVTMDDDVDGDGGLVRHAECSDAMALLAESVPEALTEERRSGAEEEAGSLDVVVPVPRGSVAHFATLDEMLDCAIRLSETDKMLTLATNPAMRAFRRWACSEVRNQAQGRPPTPWRSP